MRSTILIFLLVFPTLATGAGPVPISTYELEPAAGNQHAPAIAEGRDGFLATWVDPRDSFQGDLRATRLDGAGNVLDPSGILIQTDHPDDDGSVMAHRSFWTGSDWLVIYLWSDALRIARLAADGSIEQSPLTISSGANSPRNTFEAIVIGERIVVAGPAANGASMIVLDLSGKVTSGPVIVETSTPQRTVRAAMLARITNDVLLIDISAYACSSCPTAILHRMNLGGVELGRNVISGIDDEPRVYSFASTSAGYLLVGQNYGARVESWLLNGSLTSVASHQVISSTSKFGFAGSLLLRPVQGRTELFFFAPIEPQGVPRLHRASIANDGSATTAPFDISDATGGQIDIVAGTARSIAVLSSWSSATELDVRTRASTSIDGLPQAVSREITFTAPIQRDARAVRNTAETLVSWLEQPHGTASSRLYATRLDHTGKPVTVDPTLLLESADSYSIASDGLEYLVARSNGSSTSVRRLGTNLTWKDDSWIPLVESSCGDLNEHSLLWDGAGWWLGWLSCGVNPRIELRRYDRQLKPLIATVALPTNEPKMPMLASVSGGVLALWNGGSEDCHILCPPAVGKVWGARIAYNGSVSVSPTALIDDVGLLQFDFASRGSELLAIWAGADRLFATRISKDLVALDVTLEDNHLKGELLEESGLDSIDIGWDGQRWAVAARTIHYSRVLQMTETFRRFAPSDDLASAWNNAQINDLGDPSEGFALALSTAASRATILIRAIANESTTGVFRYFSSNMSEPPRTRGARR